MQNHLTESKKLFCQVYCNIRCSYAEEISAIRGFRIGRFEERRFQQNVVCRNLVQSKQVKEPLREDIHREIIRALAEGFLSAVAVNMIHHQSDVCLSVRQ